MLRIDILYRFAHLSKALRKHGAESIALIQVIIDNFPLESASLEVKDLENFIVLINLVIVFLHHQIYRFYARHHNCVNAVNSG